jgi:hypothetical protein
MPRIIGSRRAVRRDNRQEGEPDNGGFASSDITVIDRYPRYEWQTEFRLGFFF